MLLLLTALLTAHWGMPDVAWFLMAVTVLSDVLVRRRLAWYPLRAPIALFAVPLLIGVHGFFQYAAYDVAKDIWYFSKPVLELMFGCVIARRVRAERLLRTYVIAGAVASTDHLTRVAQGFSHYLANDAYANRVAFGPGCILSVIAVVFVLHPNTRRLLHARSPMLNRLLFGVAAVCGGSIALSQSRTLLLSLLIFGGLEIALNVSRAKIIALSAGLLGVVLGLLLYWGQETVVGSVTTSRFGGMGGELTFRDYSSTEDINANWRGYESYLALREFESFKVMQTILGGGFGRRVQLETPQFLAGEEFSAIPVLHNGYLYVLVKTGLIGLVVFAAALVQLLRSPWRLKASGACNARALLLWLALVLIATAGVISGPFNKSELTPVLVLYGAMRVIQAGARTEKLEGLRR